MNDEDYLSLLNLEWLDTCNRYWNLWKDWKDIFWYSGEKGEN